MYRVTGYLNLNKDPYHISIVSQTKEEVYMALDHMGCKNYMILFREVEDNE